MKFNYLLMVAAIAAILTSCKEEAPTTTTSETEKLKFETSFEAVSDFDGFYLTPQGDLGTSYHELSDSIVHSGTYAHRAWIEGTNPASTPTTNNNHRGYPTIQFQNTSDGAFKTPCYITFWVWLDMELSEDSDGAEADWFSFATFSDDESNYWDRTVLVNLSDKGIVHLQHVPNQGEQTHIYQNTSLTFPQREWVEIKTYLDFGENGYAKVWQNGTLVSHANVEFVDNQLVQAHFGLYAPPHIDSGMVFNDDLVIEMVDGE